MDNFDLKKFLVENKVTTNSKMLNEEQKPLEKIILKYKNDLSKQFNLGKSDVSWGDEGEPVILMDDEGNQVEFIKKEDWENNKGFYTDKKAEEITLDGINIIYIR